MVRDASAGELPLDLLFWHFLSRIVPGYEWGDDRLDLVATPARFARMWRDELLSGYRPGAGDDLRRRFTTFETGDDYGQLIVETGIPFVSLCGHHLLPFQGVVHVGYIPRRKLVGLSKIPRTVEHFSRMLQLQERLGTDIADFLDEMLKPRAVLVAIDSEHQCVALRGVQKAGVRTRTIVLRGSAKTEPSIKGEFLSTIGWPLRT